ncbi:MAG: pseudoazurin [Pseudomonadota bacterium]
MSKLTRRTFVGICATAPLMGNALAADDVIEIGMHNRDPDDKKKRNVFSPRVVRIKAGEKVRFAAADKGHNSASSKGMIPEGVDPWKGKINEEIELTFDKPGVYGYECTPHVSIGMVGLIIVEGDGMLDNLEAAQGRKQRGKAKKVWKEIWAEAEEKGLLNQA